MKRRLHITDHVVLRHLERVQGVDIESVRDEIARAVALAEGHQGACAVNVDGWSYRIEGDAVVTVRSVHQPNRRTGGRQRG